jgi:CO/xanthine dehydrogenase FAD-binding subunit
MYLQPRTLGEAVDMLARCSGRVLGGGTDLYALAGETLGPNSLLDLSRVEALAGIDVMPGRVRIGAMTTWRRIADATWLPPCFDALRAAAREVGSIQIQNRATVGGNLCNASPAADGVPPLLALDAKVELTAASGVRELALSDFILGNRRTALRPGELLTAVLVPRSIDRGRSSFLKLGARRYLVISVAMVAAVIELDESRCVSQARVAVGACSPVAQRLTALEQALTHVHVGTGLGASATSDHLAMLAPIDDMRAPAAYRLDAALTLVRRALDACVTDE